MGTEQSPRGFGLGSAHQIVHRRAPAEWQHGFPLGNGVLGVMVWGDGQPLAFTLDRADLWDTRLDRSFMDHPDFTYEGLRRLVAEQRFDEALEVFEERQRRDNPVGPTKIGVGRAELFLGAAAEYRVHLDIDRAVVEGTMCTAAAEHGLRAFVARHRNLLCLRVDPAPADAPMRVLALQETGDELEALGLPEPQTRDEGPVRVLVQEAPDGSFVAVAWNLAGPAFLVAAEMAPTADGAADAALATAQQGAADGFDRIYAEHVTAWAHFWQESAVCLPEERMEFFWYYGVYLLASAARQGSTPPGLQGVWAMDGVVAPWGGDYHADMNVQETFWPACASGHLDLLDSWCDYMQVCLEPAREFTRRFFGTEGTFWPCSTAPHYTLVNCWYTAQFAWSHTGWLAWLVWLRWRYSMDVDWLAATGYPLVAEVFRFYRANLEEEADGLLHVPLSTSPEYGDNRPEAWCKDPNVDLALIRRCCDWVVEMEQALDLDALSAAATQVRQQLVPYHLSEEGALCLWSGQPLDESHRHPSQLMAIHPCMDLTIDQDEETRTIIEASVEQFLALGQYRWAGHTYAQLISLAAVLGRAGWAYESLLQFAEHWTGPNGLHFNRDLTDCGMSAYRRPPGSQALAPFTMEANCGVSAGISDMLVQGWNDVVRIFPAVPEHWADLAFENLRTEGGFRISAWRCGGRTAWVRIVAGVYRVLRLRDPFDGARVTITGGQMQITDGLWTGGLEEGQEVVMHRDGVTLNRAAIASRVRQSSVSRLGLR